ncbi:hypothetical protein ACLB1G_27090 [Oxalobacteraceae bacterium A2-2]
MNNLKNLIGTTGEYLCGAELMRPVAGGLFLFDAYLMGGTAPTFDYIVYLLDMYCDRSGPFFFLQVKTTFRPNRGAPYLIDFSARDVKRAQATKIPFFLCVIDLSVPRFEKFFIKGVDSTRTKGIARVAPRFDLASDAVKLGIHKEVTRLWAVQQTPALAEFI